MRLRVALIVGLVVAGGLFSSRGADAARQKLAVLGIEARDESDARSRKRSAALAKTLTSELRARAADAGYDAGAAKDLLELKLLSDCLDENALCMAGIGRELGVDVLVYGHLEKQRNGYTVSLYRLDVATRSARPIEAPKPAATEDGMRKVASTIALGPPAEPAAPVVAAAPPEPAKLVVATNVPASIRLNGAPRGETAAGQPLVMNDVSGGTNRLEVEAPGMKRWANPIDVQPHGRTDVNVTLEPVVASMPLVPPAPAQPEPAKERPGGTARVLFWTSLVATGAGVAAFTITGLQVRSIEKEQDAAIAEWGDTYKANGVQFPNDACSEARHDNFSKLVDICDRGQNMATVTNVLVGVTAAAAVATAFFYWRGYMSTSETERPRSAKLRTIPIVAPEVYKSGAGLGAVIQF